LRLVLRYISSSLPIYIQYFPSHCKLWMWSRVELPIIKHYPIFSSHSLTKLSDFCVIGCTNLRVTNVFWASKVKEQRKEHKKEGKGWMIVCFNFFERIALDSPQVRSNFNPISSSFLVHFEWLKTWWMHQLGLYKTSKTKDAMIKDFKLKTLNRSSPTIKH
jgi:hypothetical protein